MTDADTSTLITTPSPEGGVDRGEIQKLLSVAYYIQCNHPEWYGKKLKSLLAGRSLEWSLENPELLVVLRELSGSFLEDFQNTPEFAGCNTPAEAEERIVNTVPQDTIDTLIEIYESEGGKSRLIRQESERLAKEYVQELKKKGVTLTETDERWFTNRVASGIENSFTQQLTAKEFAAQATRVQAGELEMAGAQKRIPSQQIRTASAVTKQLEHTSEAAWHRIDKTEKVKQQVLTILFDPEQQFTDIHRPDLLAVEYRRLAHETTEPLTDVSQVAMVKKAAAVVKAAEPLWVAVDETKAPDIAGEFITSLAKPGRQGAVAALTAMLSPEQKQQVAALLLQDGLQRLVRHTDVLQTELGSSFIKSPLFAMIQEGMRSSLTSAGRGGGAPSALGGFAASILRGPLTSQLLLRPAEAPVLHLLRLAQFDASLPENMRFIPRTATGVMGVPRHTKDIRPVPLNYLSKIQVVALFQPQQLVTRLALMGLQEKPSSLSSMLNNLWFVFVVQGRKTLGKEAVSAAGKAAVGGGIWGWLTKSALGKVVGGFFTGSVIGGPVGGVAGGLLTFAGGSFISGTIGKILHKFANGSPFLNIGTAADAVKDWFGGARTKATPFLKNKVVISILALVTLPLLIVMRSPKLLGIEMRGTAMVSTAAEIYTESVSESGIYANPGGAGPNFTYNGPMPPPFTPTAPSQVTECPVNGGSITQGPYGSYSHANLNAFDLSGVPLGTPVYATHDGYIVNYRATFVNNQKLYGSYGNFVLMVGTDQNNQKVFTMYAHLTNNIAQVVVDAYNKYRNTGEQTLITAGTQIGEMDNTGYSTGTHLHFEYVGPGGTLVLPPGCP